MTVPADGTYLKDRVVGGKLYGIYSLGVASDIKKMHGPIHPADICFADHQANDTLKAFYQYVVRATYPHKYIERLLRRIEQLEAQRPAKRAKND